MTRWERIGLQIALWGVAGTGLVYAWMKYGLRPGDPFALVNHPWQPAALHWHVIAAPVLVFFIGMLARSHVFDKLAGGGSARRRSGWGLVVAATPMVLSGYWIQVSLEDWARTWSIGVHLVSSGLFVLFFVTHLYRMRAGLGAADLQVGSAQRSDVRLRLAAGRDAMSAS